MVEERGCLVPEHLVSLVTEWANGIVDVEETIYLHARECETPLGADRRWDLMAMNSLGLRAMCSGAWERIHKNPDAPRCDGKHWSPARGTNLGQKGSPETGAQALTVATKRITE